jgi:hypothetical protein
MRLVLFVLSITFSAGLFAWKTNMLADMNETWQSMAANPQASKPEGFADQMMAMAMAAMGGGGPAAAALSGAAPSGAAAPVVPGMAETKATYDEIGKQLGGFGGGAGSSSSFSRPKELSARFVKARESN